MTREIQKIAVMAAPLSAYELQRAANIRQNNAKLEALGLDGPQPEVTLQPVPRQPAQARKRKPAPAAAETNVRRSSRNQSRVDYSEPRVPGAAPSSSAKPAHSDEPAAEGGEADKEAGEDGAEVVHRVSMPFIDDRPPAEKQSTRAVPVQVPGILESVGQLVAGPCTKESVVAMLAGGTLPRFSKYLGALEWRNAVSLFVNVGGAEYNNLFLDGGRQVTWFAGSQQHDETPIIRRLLGTAHSSSTTVLLFCRLVVPITQPYVCCGKLKYVSHDFRRRPLKFTWELEQREELVKSAAFAQLLNFK